MFLAVLFNFKTSSFTARTIWDEYVRRNYLPETKGRPTDNFSKINCNERFSFILNYLFQPGFLDIDLES